MIDIESINYSILDRPEVTAFLFHPRPGRTQTDGEKDFHILVEDDIVVGGRFHTIDKTAPNILFFHGNGEIVEDYDDFADVLNRQGINFYPVDYRGYGTSTGKPGVTMMMRDCHVIFRFFKEWLKNNGYTGPVIVMGRSLGSASAIELACHYADDIDGLIVESGFAFVKPLLLLLGINVEGLEFKEEDGLRNREKISEHSGPLLVIHAEQDQIIPISDGKTLFESSPSQKKEFLAIPGAGHNDIFFFGFSQYMDGIKRLIGGIMKP